MFCKNCGKLLNENTNFCPECGCNINSSVSKSIEVSEVFTPNNSVSFEVVKEKKYGIPEKCLVFLSCFVIFVDVIIPLFCGLAFGFDGAFDGIKTLRGIIVAVVLFGIAIVINQKRKLTDHYKFICPYCEKENSISADETNTFKCDKCEKTFAIVNGEIKNIS